MSFNHNYSLSTEEIKTRSDIIDIIGQVMVLNRKGNRYWGLCPFHQEKTPSFSVNPERQQFYCFGCHATGDTISFVMQYYHLAFKEARDWLSQRYGIFTDTTPQTRAATRRAIQERTRQRQQKLYLQALMDSEYYRLIAFERAVYRILDSIKYESDLDRPEVAEALKAKDKISYYLDIFNYAEPADKLSLALSIKEVEL